MGNKEFGGVVLAFGGFVLLVGAVKGTWRNAWAALTGGAVPAASAQTTGTTPKGGKGSLGNSSTNLPGSAPAPFTQALG